MKNWLNSRTCGSKGRCNLPNGKKKVSQIIKPPRYTVENPVGFKNKEWIQESCRKKSRKNRNSLSHGQWYNRDSNDNLEEGVNGWVNLEDGTSLMVQIYKPLADLVELFK